MSARTINRLWMAWSLVLLAATTGVLWISPRIMPGFEGREALVSLRNGTAQFDAAEARIEPIATQLEGAVEEVSRIARRQLPRSPFGLVEPPFVQEMRRREETLLASLVGIREQLQESKRQILDLRQELKRMASSTQSDLEEVGHQIGLLEERSVAKSFVSDLALALIAAVSAVSTFLMAWQRRGRTPRKDHRSE